ncbi:IS6 family transposase (plasmid) [Salmonella enterica subsp. enterica serovar Typhi]|nr:IS6 family transposase [Salmonella enterica subsp. enterica serovar Typhi]
MTDFKWRHFQGDVILWAVRWYCRYPISYRDLEEMLAERGISVDHTTIYRWVQCYGHCCKVSDEAAFCLIQRPYISKTLLTRRISPRGSP